MPDEVDFLQNLHEALYFRCGDDRYYLKNGVHQGSPISPALFNIYLEDMIDSVTRECTDIQLWHKAYADDLVLCVSHTHLERVLATLKR